MAYRLSNNKVWGIIQLFVVKGKSMSRIIYWSASSVGFGGGCVGCGARVGAIVGVGLGVYFCVGTGVGDGI